jgi:hypothetical protein
LADFADGTQTSVEAARYATCASQKANQAVLHTKKNFFIKTIQVIVFDPAESALHA